MSGKRRIASSAHTTRTKITFCQRRIPKNTSAATNAPTMSQGSGEPSGEKGRSPARHISYADASRKMAAWRYTNAAWRNFTSSGVRARTAATSDIVDVPFTRRADITVGAGVHKPGNQQPEPILRNCIQKTRAEGEQHVTTQRVDDRLPLGRRDQCDVGSTRARAASAADSACCIHWKRGW